MVEPKLIDLIELADIFENDKMELEKIGDGDISKIAKRYMKFHELNKAPEGKTECNEYTPCIKGCGEIKSKNECINKETDGAKICIWDEESKDCSGFKICFRNKCINKEDSVSELLDYLKDLKNKLRECNSDPDCSGNKKRCINNKCYECVNNDDCGEKKCFRNKCIEKS